MYALFLLATLYTSWTVCHVPVMFEPTHHEIEEEELRRISLLNQGLRELNLSLSRFFRGKEEDEEDASEDEIGGANETMV